MNRRSFLRHAVAATATAVVAKPLVHAADPATSSGTASAFRMKYAPHAGQFESHAGKGVLDQIRFARSAGFTAWEDNGMLGRERGEQDAMAALFKSLGMTLGVFVAYAEFTHPTFAGNRLDVRERKRDPQAVRALLAEKMEATVELAKRVGARWCTVVPGAVDPSLLPEHQMANVAENLRFCADICEKAGVILVLEPLNYMDHPGCFLQRAAQAHHLCKLVASPSVKILFDVYHQQITEGNLITNMTAAWDEIVYIQVGDVPGRKEPTSGEINYKHIFQWLHERGYDGVVGMEHGLRTRGLDGEKALIQAYRSVDLVGG